MFYDGYINLKCDMFTIKTLKDNGEIKVENL